jgi:probable F420-dependent oxidoreductase
MTAPLGRVGIWASARSWTDDKENADAAAELDGLGVSALWLGGVNGDLKLVSALLDATSRLTLSTGIVNMWMYPAADVAAVTADVNKRYPGRFVLGVGIGHAPSTEAMGLRYDKPFVKMVEYFDALDAAPTPVAVGDRLLAALGPKALKLAAERSAGSHPYLVTPDHTAQARAVLGAGKVLAPEQKVVLETDPAKAREIARKGIAVYLKLPNYTNNLKRLGFTDDDLAAPGSDRLVDGIVAWGDVSTAMARVQAHLDAGADHVAVNVISATPSELPRAAWRELAPAFPGS